MKQRLRRLTAMLLAGGLICTLAGCGQKKEETMQTENTKTTGAKGRYVERQLATPEGYRGIGTMSIQEDGTWVIVDTINGTFNTSANQGETWETAEHDILQQLLAINGMEITSTAVAPNGGLFISYVPWNESTEDKLYPEKYLYVDEEGNQTEFELGIDDYHSSTLKAVFTQTGRLFSVFNNGEVYEIHIAEQSSSKVLGIEETYATNLFSCGNTIAVIGGKKAYFLDMETGKLNASDSVLNDYVEADGQYPDTVVLSGKGTEKIYTASASGIYSHVMNGSVMEQLAEGGITNLGDPSKTPSELFVIEEDWIIILYGDGELDSYIYDPEVPTVPEQQLTIYSLYDNDTVRQTISSFRKAYPDVYVKMEVGITGEDGVTENDAIKNLNTELLAGMGPDLILLDGMPLQSYIEKGMLMDLASVVEELQGENRYYENMLKAYQEEEKIYAIPIRYYMPLISGEDNMISGITDLQTLADAVEQQAASGTVKQTVLGTYRAQDTLEFLYPVCESAWYQADGSVDKTAIREFLTQAKRIYQGEQKNLDDYEREAYEEMMAGRSSLAQGRRFQTITMSGDNQLYQKCTGRSVIAAGLFWDMRGIQTLVSINQYLKNNSYQVFAGQSKNVFVPVGIAGINASSEERELAAAFLKLILGLEVQAKDLGDGFPVNRDAFASFSENPYPNSSECTGFSDLDGNDIMLDIRWPTDEELTELEKHMESLQIPVNLDRSLYDEIIAIGKMALTGEKEIEDSVEEICQKITLHLQE